MTPDPHQLNMSKDNVGMTLSVANINFDYPLSYCALTYCALSYYAEVDG